ncbi:uncharacterized protein F4812DRAFT_460132 [Daldinia caldariorum]|uniref:uncharacterized protein n=1 Tax=Daldinia caldariorum TaxID=326644 RepID=UPI0020089100|nr:uncharacterized protein F4812DRAFT_460132 [Daldinia caldariorum]KAI1467283.1 hypothetical protein F4812DRAFT_460132 [Daldinia caldariorum]
MHVLLAPISGPVSRAGALGAADVCGETVVRGEEGVSLGWCFWHRACYGCLFCGSRLVVHGPTVAQLFDDDDDGKRAAGEGYGGGGGGGEGLGREILEVPTCAHCAVECQGQGTVVRNALRRVDESDGGLASARWTRIGGQMVGRRAVGEIKRVPVATSKPGQSPLSLGRSRWSIQGGTRTSHDPRASSSHLPVDGTLSGPGNPGDDNADYTVPLDPVIYVSIFDPVNDPAFKPSPTKPIPKWMRWLPSRREQRSETRPHSILDEYFPPSPIEPDTASASKLPTICPTSPLPNPMYSAATPRPLNHYHAPQSSEPSKLTNSTVTALKGPSFVLDEPLKRPSSRVTYHPTSTNPRPVTSEYIPRSHAAETEAEALLSPRSRTPVTPRPLTRHRPPSPLTEQVAAHLRRFARRTPPAQSREFLNTYHYHQHNDQQPTGARKTSTTTTTTTTPSIALPGRRRDKGVADGRQVWSILGRDRTPSPGAGGGAGARQVVTDGGEVVDVRSLRKRSSLQSEIKRFLSGRGVGRE